MLGSLGAGNILLAAAAYDSDALRQTLAERGAWANVKPMPRQRHILAFSSFLYRYRNRVERFFNKLKHFRAVATRYDKNRNCPGWATAGFGEKILSTEETGSDSSIG